MAQVWQVYVCFLGVFIKLSPFRKVRALFLSHQASLALELLLFLFVSFSSHLASLGFAKIGKWRSKHGIGQFAQARCIPSELILIVGVREPWEGQCSLASKLLKMGKHEIQKMFLKGMVSTHFLNYIQTTSIKKLHNIDHYRNASQKYV